MCKECKATGINFVWLDALCITKENTISEIKKMENIYRMSILTIAYPGPLGYRQDLFVGNRLQDWFNRVWTLQEGLLPDNMFFMTLQAVKYEIGYKREECVEELHKYTVKPYHTLFSANGDYMSKRKMSYIIDCLTPKDRSIMQIMQLVGRRKSTFPGDVIIGCSALIKDFDIDTIGVDAYTPVREVIDLLYDRLDTPSQAQMLTLQYYDTNDCINVLPRMDGENGENIRTIQITDIVFTHVNNGNKVLLISKGFTATTTVQHRLILKDNYDMDTIIYINYRDTKYEGISRCNRKKVHQQTVVYVKASDIWYMMFSNSNEKIGMAIIPSLIIAETDNIEMDLCR